MSKQWFRNHVAYTMAKYGMSMCVLGMAEEFAADGIAVNALWPRTGLWCKLNSLRYSHELITKSLSNNTPKTSNKIKLTYF